MHGKALNLPILYEMTSILGAYASESDFCAPTSSTQKSKEKKKSNRNEWCIQIIRIVLF